MKVRTLVRRDFDQAFQRADAILLPTTPTPPFKLGEKVDDPLAMYLNDMFSIPASLAGAPALSFPSGRTRSGLPIGLQLVGKPFEEGTLLRVARTWEKKSGDPLGIPPIVNGGGRA
jgi:aspartyl-tRNA(Asn)/glutamyl-tRNA(Gln) amidotransferase subunit A